MRAVRIVAAREFTQTVRTRTFLLTTVLGLLGLVVLSFLPTLLNWLENRSGSRVTEVIVFDQVGGIYPAMVQSSVSPNPTMQPWTTKRLMSTSRQGSCRPTC